MSINDGWAARPPARPAPFARAKTLTVKSYLIPSIGHTYIHAWDMKYAYVRIYTPSLSYTHNSSLQAVEI